jgi:hypothetical protein
MLLLDKSTLQVPELHQDVSAGQQEPACAVLNVSTSQGAELHLDVSTQQRFMLHLDVSTPPGPELHLDASTLKGPELQLDMPRLVRKQEPVLLMELSTPQ